VKGEFVFVQTNEAGENRLLAFQRERDGRLTTRAAVATGGRGDGIPHLTSQGSVVLTSDGEHVLVTNAGSSDVSVLSAGAMPEVMAVVPSGGEAPKSVAEHDGLVYVLNSGDAALSGFTLSDGKLGAVPSSRRELGEGADPAQVGFTPDGAAVVVTDRGSNAIVVYPVGAGGLLGDPSSTMSAGPTPYGFAFAAGGTLVVTEAFGAAKGKAAASSYRLHGSAVEPVTESVGNGRSEICWAVASADGRHVFTTNFADGAVSRYEVAADGTLSLVAAVAATAVEGQPGLRDEDLSGDGRFLYALDADAGRIFAWRVDDGNLEPAGSWNGLPATVAGLAAS
jgi:6-phosphogluconolactonase (cycloisomerase 2 family)